MIIFFVSIIFLDIVNHFMYDLDIYTSQGTIIHNECESLQDVFRLVEDSIDCAQLINIQKSKL